MSSYLTIIVPFLTTLSWAIIYSARQEVFTKISLATYGMMAAQAYFVVFFITYWIIKPHQDWGAIAQDKKLLYLLGILLLLEGLAMAAMCYSIVLAGASFTAFINLLLPVFVTIIGWLLFSRLQINGLVVMGGMIMLVGAFITAWGRTKL